MSSSNNSTLVVGLVVAGLTLVWGGTVGFLLAVHLQQNANVTVEKEKKKKKELKELKARARETSITNGEDVKMMDKQNIVDVRIAEIRPLLPPACLLEEIPRTVNIARTVNKGRQGVANVLRRVDDRLVVVVGPCSIHDVKAAFEYAEKLKKVADELENDLLIVMRVYFEKPRTTVGWKGLINDPDINGTFNINKGLRIARELLSEINQLGLPAGCEFLDTISPQFFGDLVSWGAIGARTTECQLHRELTSGLSMPVGFKNGTGGSLQLAVDAVVSAAHPHCFLSVSNQGLAAIVSTSGNDACHVILRGGTTGPNYQKEHVDKVSELLKKTNHVDNVMVDCSHGNSNKNHKNQVLVAQDLANQIADGDNRIVGLMLESNLVAGAQKLNPGVPLEYGKSITDACIGWDETVTTLKMLAEAVQKRRNALSVEYLLNVQESLVSHAEQLENQCEQALVDTKNLTEENEKIEMEVQMLKQEIKQKQNTISTYELMLLTQQKQSTTMKELPQAQDIQKTAPVECILCNKKFLSVEYLVKHQKKKHVNEASRLDGDRRPFVVETAAPEEKLPSTTPPTAQVEPAPPQPDMTLVNSLITANTTILTKQIEGIQAQLAHDKEDRRQETQMLNQQHQSFAEKIMDHMARMQDALKDMQRQSVMQREEWTHFATGLMQKVEKQPRVEHIGPIVNDAEEQWRRDILAQLKAQREEEKQRRLDHEAERKIWEDRQLKLQELLDQREMMPPTLTQVMAMEAQKYGIDYGLTSPQVNIDSQIQTELNVRDSQQQTDEENKPRPILVEKEANTDPVDLPRLVKQESGTTVMPLKTAVVKEDKKTNEARIGTVELPKPMETSKKDPPPPITSTVVKAEVVESAAPPVLSKALSQPQPSGEHTAATKLQKVASGYITRKHLGTAENWLLRYGNDIAISVTQQMTANNLRAELANKLGGIDPHRVVLHHVPTGRELVGDALIFQTHGHLEIEVVPEHDLVLDAMVEKYAHKTKHIQSHRLAEAMAQVDDYLSFIPQIVLIQAHTRGMLCRRQVTEMKIDRLVETRLKELRLPTPELSILHSPRALSTAVQVETVKVQKRLQKAMSDIHGGSVPQKAMSQAAFEISMRNLQEARKQYPPPLQTRIADLTTTIHDAAMKNFDPLQAKRQEVQSDAATAIQSIVRVALAKKLVSQLAKEKHSDEKTTDEKSSTQSAAESKPRHEEDDELKAPPPENKEADDKDESQDDDDAMTVEDFNEEKMDTPKPRPQTPQESFAAGKSRSDNAFELKREYDEEKEKLRAIKDDAASRISPYSTSVLQSTQRRNSRGTTLHNAR
ncbi:hypothetical protein LEN26_010734 [Aphanomyces euteiches]|nr:hypothetical protein LEN26_010734 [Aphanomyces euteiches]KAH9127446.1 hypothetical protein AeMF1_002259 [Aphanomyces euteiches]KAH9193127.1 hypothetical protein AeNC1_004904 [Aphanomyces euteiches]